MPAYDAILFSPPAPLERVTLRNPANGGTVSDVPMLLDSGADVTLVPRACVDRLGAAIGLSKGYELRGFDGNMTLAQAVELHMVFLGRTFRGRFLLTDEPWGILGRNVLNCESVASLQRVLYWSAKEQPRFVGQEKRSLPVSLDVARMRLRDPATIPNSRFLLNSSSSHPSVMMLQTLNCLSLVLDGPRLTWHEES